MSAAADPRESLPRTFGTFFGRFSELTEVQRRALPPIAAGRDALLCAPTASGKTEAYAAPLVERLLAARGKEAGEEGFRLLLVSPTRALGNDLKRRLDARMEALGVSFGRYTGEHKERLAGRLPEAAVTTPEALDSILARRPHVLHRLGAIVLDEIHVLDGTPRGDQLRVLLHRLLSVAKSRPQHVAASATVGDPAAMASRYLCNAEIVEVRGTRSILARTFEGTDAKSMARHLEELAAAGLRKVLVFCNRRNDVEELAAAARGATAFGAEVYAHHGSIARPQRERVEKRFLEAPAAVVFATLTLELGIDIGDVDYVLCHRPPSSVASLLQRLGRGNRRSGETRVGVCADGDADRLRYGTLLRLAARGELCSPHYSFRPSVLVQQAIVLAGTGYVTSAMLAAAIPDPPGAELDEPAARRILESMVGEALLEPARGGRYVLSERSQAQYERGRVHSNIQDEPETEVVDRLTGEIVGFVARTTDPNAPADGTLRVGGQSRRAVARRGARVLTDATGEALPARFVPRHPPSISFALARAIARELGCGEREILQKSIGHETLLVHGLGGAGGVMLRWLLERRSELRVLSITGITACLDRPIGELPHISGGDLEKITSSEAEALAPRLALGPYHSALPRDLRHRAVRDAAGFDALATFLRSATLRSDLLQEAPGWWAAL